MKGRKPKSRALRVVGGNAGKRKLPSPDPVPLNTLERPPGMHRGAARKVWDSTIGRCWWLTWADSTKAEIFVHLLIEFRKSPSGMNAARIGQLRTIASELGLDQAARTRMGLPPDPGASPKPTSPKAAQDPGEKYLENVPTPASKYFS